MTTETCHEYVTLQPGDTPQDWGCPPSINSATVHPAPGPGPGPSFTLLDYALWGGAVLILVLAVAVTIVILLKRTNRAKHPRESTPTPK